MVNKRLAGIYSLDLRHLHHRFCMQQHLQVKKKKKPWQLLPIQKWWIGEMVNVWEYFLNTTSWHKPCSSRTVSSLKNNASSVTALCCACSKPELWFWLRTTSGVRKVCNIHLTHFSDKRTYVRSKYEINYSVSDETRLSHLLRDYI